MPKYITIPGTDDPTKTKGIFGLIFQGKVGAEIWLTFFAIVVAYSLFRGEVIFYPGGIVRRRDNFRGWLLVTLFYVAIVAVLVMGVLGYEIRIPMP